MEDKSRLDQLLDATSRFTQEQRKALIAYAVHLGEARKAGKLPLEPAEFMKRYKTEQLAQLEVSGE